MMEAVVNVAFGEKYVEHQARLRESIARFWGGRAQFWTNEWPPGSPEHRECHYAFKYYAVAAAVKEGATRMLYLDACMYCVTLLDPIFKQIERDGFYFAGGWRAGQTFQDLRQFVGDEALEWQGVRREELVNAGVVAGGTVGLDLNHPTGRELWAMWPEMIARGLTMVHYRGDKPEGKIRSISNEGNLIAVDPMVKAHLGDEATWSLILWKRSLEPDGFENFYGSHFDPRPSTILRSGYDL